MPTEEKQEVQSKRYATRFGQHYSIVMRPTVTKIVNGYPMTEAGHTIVFENGVFETDDATEQHFLENCRQYGRDFKEVTQEVDYALEARSLEDREATLKEREDEVARREMELKGQNEGADVELPEEEKQRITNGNESNQTKENSNQSSDDNQNDDSENGNSDEVDATDSARELASQNGIDIATVKGSGENGRVVKTDVESAIEQKASGEGSENSDNEKTSF